MAESTTEKAPSKELQDRLILWLTRLHRLTFNSYGAEGQFAPGWNEEFPAKDEASDLADEVIIKFNDLYRQIPDDHHLKISLTPGRYMELAGDSEVGHRCHIEKTDAGPTYWLSVGKRIDPFMLKEGYSVLNIVGFGQSDPENPKCSFGLQLVSKEKGYADIGRSIYPQDILAIKVERNPVTTSQ